HWYLPPRLPDEDKERLARDQAAHVTSEVWPQTPHPHFGNRSPLQLAQAGNNEAILRGAVLLLEPSSEVGLDQVDWASLRARLGIPPEPAIDPETVNIDELPICRLNLVPLDRLDNDRLVKLYLRANEFGLIDLPSRAARQIADREGLIASGKVQALLVYADLALSELQNHNRNAALAWIRQGRAVDAPSRRADLACHWDLMELQIKAQFDRPEDWVPELAVILERYQGNEDASPVITTRLLEMGLVKIVSPPDRPGEVALDARTLQQLLSLYGPQVTTASGVLGVSATKGEIWTPSSDTKGSIVWTPGSDAGPSGGPEKPKIIVTG
ncbi:MAG: SEC-C domain-containing protein, partial [Isosphaeraceae bacterium]